MRFQALVKALKNESLHIFLCNNNHNYILTIQRLTPWAVPFWDTIIVARSSSDDRFVSLRPVCHERGGGGWQQVSTSPTGSPSHREGASLGSRLARAGSPATWGPCGACCGPEGDGDGGFTRSSCRSPQAAAARRWCRDSSEE